MTDTMTRPNTSTIHIPATPAGAELALNGFTVTSLNPTFELARLRRSFQTLPKDRYSPRFREFGRYAEQAGRLEDRPYEAYSETSNAAVGANVNRCFAPLRDETRASPALTSIITQVLELYRDAVGATGPIEIGLHQIRVTTDATRAGEATPEGPHQDGNSAFAAVLLGRYCTGGETRIYDRTNTLLHQHTMTNVLETVMCIDHKVFHEVTPVVPNDGESDGYRDIIIVDFYETDRLDDIRNLNTNNSIPMSVQNPLHPLS